MFLDCPDPSNIGRRWRLGLVHTFPENIPTFVGAFHKENSKIHLGQQDYTSNHFRGLGPDGSFRKDLVGAVSYVLEAYALH